MAHVDIDGHPTWVEDRPGPDGTPVLLLHGGLSNSDLLLAAVGDPIAASHRIVAFDRRGHGRTADTDAPFHYEDMATEAIGVLEHVVGGPAELVGWSDGGIVALLVARRRPDLVERMVLIGANYHHSGTLPMEFDENSEFAAGMYQAYVERSPDGAEHFGAAMEKALTLFTSEPTLTTADLARIAVAVLVLVGDDDAIDLAHTVSLYESLPSSRLAVVPGASHAVPIEHPATVAALVLDFLAAPDPPVTLMPIRRAGGVSG